MSIHIYEERDCKKKENSLIDTKGKGKKNEKEEKIKKYRYIKTEYSSDPKIENLLVQVLVQRERDMGTLVASRPVNSPSLSSCHAELNQDKRYDGYKEN